MRKSLLSKILAFVFVCGLMSTALVFMESCGKPKYNKPRNGGKRVSSSGKVGFTKDKNRHVWGK